MERQLTSYNGQFILSSGEDAPGDLALGTGLGIPSLSPGC
jgi:hypothetical protein